MSDSRSISINDDITTTSSESDDSGSNGSANQPLNPIHFTNDFYVATQSAHDFITYQNTSFGAQIKGAFIDTFRVPFVVLWKVLGMEDIFNTCTRLFQVISTCVANDSNSDAPTNDALFYKVTTVNGQATDLTVAGDVLLAGGLAAPIGGVGKEVHHNYRIRYVASLSYHVKRLNVIQDEHKKNLQEFGDHADLFSDFSENNHAAVEAAYCDLAYRNKVVNLLDEDQQRTYENKQALNDAYQLDEFSKFMNLFSGKLPLNEKNILVDIGCSDNYSLPEGEKPRRWYEKLISGMSLYVKAAWNFINNAGFFYWLVWFPFVLAVGIIPASTSPFFALIIISVTATLTVGYTIATVLFEGFSFTKTKEDIKKRFDDRNKEAEKVRMNAEYKYRHFMKVDHKDNMAYVHALDPKAAVKKGKEAKDPVKYPRIVLARDKDEVQKSNLGRRMLKGSTALMALAIVRDIVNAIIMVSFAFWILSASAFAIFGAVPGLAFLDNMVISGGLGIGMAGFFAILKYAEMKTKNLDYEKTVHEAFCEKYKDSNLTKLEKFESLEQQVEFKKARVEWLRLKVLLNAADAVLGYHRSAKKIANEFSGVFDGNTAEHYQKKYKKLHAERLKLEKQLKREGKIISGHDLAAKYDLDRIDVYNHEYREKQRHEAGLWTKAKRLGNRAWALITGMQTGMLLVRVTCMAGGLFGGIAVGTATGTLPVFLGILAVLAVAYGIVCAVQYHMESKRRHQENFVKNMNGNISYLIKKNKELDSLDPYLSEKAGMAPLVPQPEIKQEVEQVQELVISHSRSASRSQSLSLSGSANSGMFSSKSRSASVDESSSAEKLDELEYDDGSDVVRVRATG